MGPDDSETADEPQKVAIVDIVADVREQPSATFAVLASRSDVALTVATLKFGDYSVGAQLSFERKTPEDLGRSIIDGRLFRQVSVLRYRVDRPILLVEGLQSSSSLAGVAPAFVRPLEGVERLSCRPSRACRRAMWYSTATATCPGHRPA